MSVNDQLVGAVGVGVFMVVSILVYWQEIIAPAVVYKGGRQPVA
jgi:hypothetical protein